MKIPVYKILYWDVDREPDFIQAIDECMIMSENELRKEFKINIPYITPKEWEDFQEKPENADNITIDTIIYMLEAMADYGFDIKYCIYSTYIEI